MFQDHGVKDVTEETDTILMGGTHTTPTQLTTTPEAAWCYQPHTTAMGMMPMSAADCHRCLLHVTLCIVTSGDSHLTTTADLHHLGILTMTIMRDAGNLCINKYLEVNKHKKWLRLTKRTSIDCLQGIHWSISIHAFVHIGKYLYELVIQH